jgi:hypothetical protein
LDSGVRHVLPGASLNTITPLISHNFAIARVWAILLVATGHFFGSLLWIPVTLCLFTFAWSSALFTTLKHDGHVNVAAFWRGKLRRPGLRFLFIQFFLLALAAVRGQDGIFSWQTLMHLTGQSGWLDWFGIWNASPLGNGLWFFTLLLIFYLVFPVFSRWQRDPRNSLAIVSVTLVLALWLSKTVNVGHALWITAAAFVIGIHCARHPLSGTARTWLILAVTGAFCLGLLNAGLGIRAANNALIVFIALAAVQWLEKTDTALFAGPLARLAPCVLEIYLIHTYFFVGAHWPRPIAYLASMAIITVVALALNFAATRLETRFFPKR